MGWPYFYSTNWPNKAAFLIQNSGGGHMLPVTLRHCLQQPEVPQSWTLQAWQFWRLRPVIVLYAFKFTVTISLLIYSQAGIFSHTNPSTLTVSLCSSLRSTYFTCSMLRNMYICLLMGHVENGGSHSKQPKEGSNSYAQVKRKEGKKEASKQTSKPIGTSTSNKYYLSHSISAWFIV